MCNSCYIRWRKARKPKVSIWCKCGLVEVSDRRRSCKACSDTMRVARRKREASARKSRYVVDEEYRLHVRTLSKRSAVRGLEKRRVAARERARKLRADPEYRAKASAEVRRRRRADPERHWEYDLRKRGMTRTSYLALLQQQRGVCAICKQRCKSGRRLAIDHSHETGRVRGLLCSSCNTAIGLMKEDIQRLSRAARYLLKAGGAC
jgi:hypothetical protein